MTSRPCFSNTLLDRLGASLLRQALLQRLRFGYLTLDGLSLLGVARTAVGLRKMVHVGGWTAGSRLRSLRSFRAEHDTDRREQDVQVRQQRKIADVDEVVSETIFGIAAVGAEHV